MLLVVNPNGEVVHFVEFGKVTIMASISHFEYFRSFISDVDTTNVLIEILKQCLHLLFMYGVVLRLNISMDGKTLKVCAKARKVGEKTYTKSVKSYKPSLKNWMDAQGKTGQEGMYLDVAAFCFSGGKLAVSGDRKPVSSVGASFDKDGRSSSLAGPRRLNASVQAFALLRDNLPNIAVVSARKKSPCEHDEPYDVTESQSKSSKEGSLEIKKDGNSFDEHGWSAPRRVQKHGNGDDDGDGDDEDKQSRKILKQCEASDIPSLNKDDGQPEDGVQPEDEIDKDDENAATDLALESDSTLTKSEYKHSQTCCRRAFGGCSECCNVRDDRLSHVLACNNSHCSLSYCFEIKDFITQNGMPDTKSWSYELDKLFFGPSHAALPETFDDNEVQKSLESSGSFTLDTERPASNVEILEPLDKSVLSISPAGRYDEHYEWTRNHFIGGGQYGRVYLCTDVKSGNPFSIKEVPLENFEECEIANWRLIQGHENVVKLYGAVQTEQKIIIFMEYMDGGSVEMFLSNNGSADEDSVKCVMQVILEALCWLHSKGVVHLDLKGGNVLMDSKGIVKLADFGASVHLDDTTTHTRNIIPRGTEAFMSPEVCRSEPFGRSTDIWSAACTLYQMLTGEPPWMQYSGGSILYQVAIATKPPGIPESLECSQEIKDFMASMFLFVPEDRPTAAELLKNPIFQSGSPTASSPQSLEMEEEWEWSLGPLPASFQEGGPQIGEGCSNQGTKEYSNQFDLLSVDDQGLYLSFDSNAAKAEHASMYMTPPSSLRAAAGTDKELAHLRRAQVSKQKPKCPSRSSICVQIAAQVSRSQPRCPDCS
ncbi:uncharacterized protein LOC5525232 isoform X2 [Nematostella vectensis]|uniref:uncharacterized protein LOC5525232 isoform X2 n=1 Tax=Nematostella vectensis TaxID=45351 RepID=UPI0020778B22|nr:uncharacterized protein LOC5525232 isoform X2 [Nematostella vectensis]